MAGGSIPTLRPIQIDASHSIFEEFRRWPFSDSFVSRLLRDDIPQRLLFSNALLWAYQDTDENDLVGFGCIDVCTEYQQFTGYEPHPYIPLLAVNPGREGRGYGKAIVRHLISVSAYLASQKEPACHDLLFLDVYVTSTRARALYEKSGFVIVSAQPIYDEIEKNSYLVMAQRVSQGSRMSRALIE